MYIIVRPLVNHIKWLTPTAVPVAMAGALIPDAVKLSILLPHYEVEAMLGVPFRWFPLATLGGSLVTAAMASLVVTAEHRLRAFGLLAGGIVVHIFLDALLLKPGPTTPPKLYPFTLWEPPMIGLYLSSDIWPWVTSSVIALFVMAVTNRHVFRQLMSDK